MCLASELGNHGYVIVQSADDYILFFKSQAHWPSIVVKKWLNLNPKVHDFSEDEVDTETESEDEGMSKARHIVLTSVESLLPNTSCHFSHRICSSTKKKRSSWSGTRLQNER